jgi:hypothetical protein
MTLTLYRDSGMWCVRHTGRGSEKIRDLFGTDVLPTAFTANADPVTVYTAISKLNPDDTVILKSEVIQ